MTHFKHTFWQKQGLAAVLAVVLLLAAGCGAGSGNAAEDSAAEPGASEVTTAEPIETSRAEEESTLPAEEAPAEEEPAESAPVEEEPAAEEPAESAPVEEEPAAEGPAEEAPAEEEPAAEGPAEEAPAEEEPAAESTKIPPRPLMGIDEDVARLNCFLTSIVQQNILNTQTDLDEDAELVRFVFGYRKTNDPRSILEQDDGENTCRTLTVEQVNETLTMLFGKSISPDREDYSIILNESEGFHCFYRDGVFWNVPPYPTERYPFPIRFALVSRIDEETYTLHFRLYQANPWIWGEEETERHLGLLPFMSLFEAEDGDVFSFLGEGDAILRDFGEELQLIEMLGALKR